MKNIKFLVLVLLSCANAFLIENCMIEPQEESAKKAFEQFTGKWKLILSYDNADSSNLDVAWINLQADSLFTSNSSFFWRKDSLRLLPLNGSWSVSYYWVDKHDPSPGGAFINLKVDTLSQSWSAGLLEGTNDSIMYWHDKDFGYSRYSWKRF